MFSGIENSSPALSSYRHARLVECGIDTQAGNKNRLSRVMFCLRCVNFISCPFRSLSHKPLLIQYSVNNKRLKNERNIQLVIFFCVLHVYGNGIFKSRFIFPEITKTCLSSLAVFLCFIVNCEKLQIL